MITASRFLTVAMGFSDEHNLDVQWAHEYGAHEGQTSDYGILFANWNASDTYDKETVSRVPDYPEGRDPIVRLGRIAERLGIDCEWSDEWSTCGCGKAVRTSPDHYGWLPNCIVSDDGLSCRECLEDDTESYVDDFLLCNTGAADPFGIDLGALGFSRVSEGECGYHPGQTDSPEAMLEAAGVGDDDFVFQIEGVGQFDMAFSLWTR